jgi:DnaJ-class molecular chaperone
MFFGGGQRQQQQKRKCKARLIQMTITLEEAYLGGTKPFEYAVRETCKICFGTGSANPAAQHKCGSCQGKGIRLVIQRMGNMVLQTQQTCDECKGEGTTIKDKCKECNGEKVKYNTKTKNIDIDKGVPDGHRYSFYGEGDEYPEVDTGDLIIEIFIEKHKDFIRKGADLIYKTEITLLQALTGFSFIINHLNGKKILIKSKEDEIIKPGVLKTVHELGMPFNNAPYKFGNLYLEFDLIFPDKLESDQTTQISEVNFKY